MGADGRLQYEILGNASGLTKAVDGAISKIGSMGAKVAGLAAGAGALGALAAVIKSVTVAADFERATISFTALIGSVERAKAAVAQLREFAKVTPFEFGDIQEAAIALLNAGIPAESLVKHLTALGNAASVTGGSISEISAALSKAINAGQLTGEVMEMFTSRGVNAFKLVADEVGVTTEALREMMSQGEVRASSLVAALQRVYGAGGKMGDLMEKQSRSTLGLFSNLKDAVNEVFLVLGKPINDAIKPILEGAVALAGELRPVLAGLGEQIAHAVTAMYNFVANANKGAGVVAELGNALAEVFTTLGSYAAAGGRVLVTAFAGAVSPLITALEPVFQWLAEKANEFAALFTDSVATAVADVLDQTPGGAGAADALQDIAVRNRLAAPEHAAAARNIDFAGPLKKAMGELADGVDDTARAWEAELEALQFRAVQQKPGGDPQTRANERLTTSADKASDALGDLPAMSSDAIRKLNAKIDERDTNRRKGAENTQQQGYALADLAILEAQAAGQDKKAQKLERELRIQQLVAQFKKELNATDAQALDLAKRKVQAEEDLARRAEGRGRKIRGFKQADGPVRGFGGLDEFYKNQAKVGRPGANKGGFIPTPGLDNFDKLQRRDAPAFPTPGQPNAGSRHFQKSAAASSAQRADDQRKQSQQALAAASSISDSGKLAALLVEMQNLNARFDKIIAA